MWRGRGRGDWRKAAPNQAPASDLNIFKSDLFYWRVSYPCRPTVHSENRAGTRFPAVIAQLPNTKEGVLTAVILQAQTLTDTWCIYVFVWPFAIQTLVSKKFCLKNNFRNTFLVDAERIDIFLPNFSSLI